MAPPSETGELRSAWRALAGERDAEGWRTIAVSAGRRPMRAGRYSPANTEALLVAFRGVDLPMRDSLPKGRGFHVVPIALEESDDRRSWIALTRESGGSPDLFSVMAEDVMSIVKALETADDQEALRLFLQRINAWQLFMERDRSPGLSAEAEIGLVGELLMVQAIIDAGVPAAKAVDGWRGPMDGLHDFVFSKGVLEVKSTVSAGTFPVRVASLQQLDDRLVPALFLTAIRLAMSPNGLTLVEIAAEVERSIAQDAVAFSMFRTRLIHAGLVGDVQSSRTYVRVSGRCMRVDREFPRLTQADVPQPVREARYTIDLDLVRSEDVPLRDALRTIGAI
jgi:Putative  PD-(D/E)XK family member, (DUF4420)